MKSFQIVLALLLASGIASAQQYLISTVAGYPGVQGCFGDGGPASAGQLDKPTQVTVDSKGNFYFADYYTYIVRMVTASTGFLSTIAGNGSFGQVPGNDSNIQNCLIATTTGQTNSELGFVNGMAVDSAGNVYVSDTSHFIVVKIDTSTNMTTFAGNVTRGYSGDGAAATAAQMYFPAGLALDKAGNLYVADYGNYTVRKIDTTGKISTVAGTGNYGYSGDGAAATKATLAQPVAVAVDVSGNIFIADPGNNNVREITSDGNIHTIASNVNAISLAVDASDNLYFVDGVSSTVQEITAGGTVVRIAGTGAPGYSQDGIQANLSQLNYPNGVALDSQGDIFVADTNNETIRKLTPLSGTVGAVVNAASNVQGPVAPGEIVTLFGKAIGPSTLTNFTATGGYIGTQIAGAYMTFNGTQAPLLYISSNLAAAIVPYEVAGSGSVAIAVSYQGQYGSTTVVPVASAAPGIFTANTTGSGQAAAVNQNGSLNTASNPAKVGSVISLYVTGEGQTSPGGQDGRIANSAPYPTPVQVVTATVGGVKAAVTYAGAAPTAVAGLMQVNVQIPAGVATGGTVPVSVSVGGVAAQPGVTIAITN